MARTDQSQSKKCSCCFPPPTLSSVCCWFSASKYLRPFREIIFNLWITKKVNMVKTAKEKTIHKAMRSADKFYTEIPGYYIHSFKFVLDKLINKQDIFSICGCFWWRDLVSVLLCVCGLHNCLCISFVKVKTMFLIPKIHIFPLNRYIDIRSMDPLDRDHKGLKIKKKQYTKSSSPEEQKCFFKEEWRCLYDPFYLVIILLLFVNIYNA